MPSLLDPTLLRGQQPGDDPTGIQTLLAGIGSALSGGVAAPNDPNTSMASFLAAANTLANAGAPTLGPPPTTAQAILGALGNARGAAVQTGILPYLQERAQQQLESQNLDYQVKLFDFKRRINAANLLTQGVSAADTGAAPLAPVAAPAAVSPPIIQRDPSVVAGDQANNPGNLMYALQPDASGRLPLSGGRTLAVFPDMPTGIGANARQLIINQDQYGLNTVRGQATRWVSDPKANLTGTDAKGVPIPNVAGTPAAPGSYIGDVAKALGVDPDAPLDFHDAGVLSKYILAMRPHESGPAALDPHDVTAGVQLALNPPAKRVQTADASGRPVAAPNAPAPSGASVGGETLVPVLGMPGLQVPRSIELAARAAGLSAQDPYAAYAKVVQDYVEKRALAPHYLQAGPPGTQIDVTSNQRVASPTGVVSLSPITPAERSSMFPQIPAWQDIVVSRDPSGRITDYKLPDMGPEPIKPIPDAQARKPVEEGGAGESYRAGTAYGIGARTGLVKPIQIERGAGPPLPATPGGPLVVTPQQQQAMDFLQTQAAKDPRIQQFQLGVGYVGRIINMAADPNRTATDDKSILAAFEKFNNPTAALSEDGQNLILTTGGPGERVQQVIAKLTGDRYLTPDVVQHVIDTVTTEAEGQRAGFTVASNNYRRMAKARGVDPDLVTPDPDEMVKDYMQQWQQSRQRLSAGTGVGGRTPVPGAAPTERAGNLPTLPVPTPQQLGGMTKEGLTALVNDMKTNPGRYTAEHHQAIETEVRRRLQRQPAQGGGG